MLDFLTLMFEQIPILIKVKNTVETIMDVIPYFALLGAIAAIQDLPRTISSIMNFLNNIADWINRRRY